MQSFLDARDRIVAFCRLVLDHLRTLSQQGILSEHSLGRALLDFATVPGITEENVLAEIQIMFIAGHETTAHTLSWFVYSLAKNPAVQKKAQEDVDAFLKNSPSRSTGAVGSPQSIPVYLEAVIKESMRKFPATATVTHRKVEAPQGITIDLSELPARWKQMQTGSNSHIVVIPKGTLVTVSNFVLQNSKSNWGPDAAEVVPERWLPSADTAVTANSDELVDLLLPDSNTTNAHKSLPSSNPLASPAIFAGGGVNSSDLAFAPFAYGPRNCIGMNLALMELRQMALQLVTHFHFELADPAMEDETIALENTITLRPKDGLLVRITMRCKE